MQYALLIYAKPGATEALGDDEAEAVHPKYLELKELPGMLGGAVLHPVETAITVRACSRLNPIPGTAWTPPRSRTSGSSSSSCAAIRPWPSRRRSR